jgi:AraC-like DNA-binding protein
VTKLGAGRSIEGRDIVLQFSANRIKDASAIFPECMDLEGLLDRSRQGLLFRGSTASDAAGLMEKIGTLRGFDRLCGFFDLMKVLAKSDDYKILSSSQFSLELDRATLEILQRVLSFLSLNFTRDVRLAEAAAIAKMAESKFSRFFKLNTGISFTDHLTRLRLRQAATLLAETNIPITNLCFDCGYSNIPNFNRRFLEHYHVTPSAYRRLLRHRRVIRTVGR